MENKKNTNVDIDEDLKIFLKERTLILGDRPEHHKIDGRSIYEKIYLDDEIQ